MADVEGTNQTPAEAAAPEEPKVDIESMLDLTKKKKKKKKATSDATDGEGGGSGGVDSGLVNYEYDALLDRIQNLLHTNNPELSERSRITLKPPQLMRMGTRKTLWMNFQEICKLLKRTPEHVFSFVVAELGTEGSIDGNQRLVLRGRYVPKYIESLLRKYIVEYVTCKMCRSPTTTLTRDSVSRLYFVHCQDCGSSRSVAAVRSGFHAQTRADRRALRNATK